MKRKVYLFIAFLLIPSICFSAQWDKDHLIGTTKIPDVATDSGGTPNPNPAALDRMLQDYREGMKLKYSTASALTVTAGQVMVENSGGTVRLMMNITADTSVDWTDIDTGAEASSTTYYVYAVAASASAETATFKISTSSTSPSGVTYYKRLGSFVNDSGSDITVVKNDNENVIVATGTVSNGGTISLPSGWSQDECNWTVGHGSANPSGSHPDGVYHNATVNSSRVATCTTTSINVSGGGSTGTTTCNYLIACYR